MWYCIYAKDSLNSFKKRQAKRPEHLKRLKLLQEEGRLLIAGPFPLIDTETPGSHGFSGSLIIAEFDTLTSAKKWADADPFFISGVYENLEVKPFKKTLP
jgi:uncharacterized protein